MSGLLVIAEHRQGKLTPATFETIAAAALVRQAGDSLSVAIPAKNPDDYIDALSVEGVDEIVKIATPMQEFQIDCHEAVLSRLIGERAPAVVAAPHSVDAWSYMPAVAASGGHGCATDVFGLRREDGELVATRAAYSEKVHMDVDFPNKRTVLLTIRVNAFKPAEGSSSPAVTALEMPDVKMNGEHRTYVEPESAGDVDITQARFILSIGRGISQEENVERFSELADAMGFTLTCSRPIADSGWLPKSRQVGQSGKTVSNCQVYIAMGISGSVQHLMGMKHVQNIIAVNTDPEASIFSIARYGIVADIFDIAEELGQHFD